MAIVKHISIKNSNYDAATDYLTMQPHAAPAFPGHSIRLIVDVETLIKAQQNRYYAEKVKIGNLQQMANTLAFLQENGIGTEE